ncbi:hypothetical protein D477_014603 [Arthrobacter crystallopoietes BAB-32]|uniref:Pyridoxamine 5-phosphate oxidase n=1 Tax=Arthrobacter crystallopoietes BAB-32 TaxID=1246476 RepID=N1USU2_9MICC|nr:DUF1697 domain-containing protein [Arthrobacter crystallopoietes]EMY33486.1 hypothetical protein D477_014603 [Arthrobacter crystallopoietes BAB-32]
MTSYAVFLRGVNVGGINIKMADLKQALAELPLEDVKTLLASGNVVCSSTAPADEVKGLIEAKLRERFGYDAWVIVLTAQRLAELVAACPYPADTPDVHAYITLASDPAALKELYEAAEAAGAEQKLLGPEASAWTVARGSTLESPVNKLSAKAKYKSTTTTRNLRTLLKVVEAAAT